MQPPRSKAARAMHLAHVAVAALLCGLAPAGSAQAVLPLESDAPTWIARYVPGVGVVAKTLAAELPPGAIAASTVCYSNDASTGVFTTPQAGEEWVDWGTKDCGLSEIVDSVSIRYATTILDPSAGGSGAALTFTVYAGTTGQGVPGTVAGRFALSALPGSPDGTLVVADLTVDLTSFSIALPDGPIGWGFKNDDNGGTGPVLVTTSGSCTDPPTFDPTTGTQDCFDRYAFPAEPDSYIATQSFMTPGRASFFVRLGEFDGTGSPKSMVVNGVGFNPVLFSQVTPPVVGTQWTTAFDLTFVPSAAATFVLLASGRDSAVVPGVIGELLLDLSAPPIFTLPFSTATVAGGASQHAIAVPLATDLIGFRILTQGAVLTLSAPPAILLTNGIEIVLGI